MNENQKQVVAELACAAFGWMCNFPDDHPVVKRLDSLLNRAYSAFPEIFDDDLEVEVD